MPPSDATVRVEYVVQCASGMGEHGTPATDINIAAHRKAIADRGRPSCGPHRVIKRTITEEPTDA